MPYLYSHGHIGKIEHQIEADARISFQMQLIIIVVLFSLHEPPSQAS